MFINKNSIMMVYPLTTGNPKSMGLYVLSMGEFVLTNDTTVQSGTTYYISMGQYIVEVKYGMHKLFSNDSGRTLSGDMVSTLIGIFPKLTLQFRKLTKAELELLAPILDSARQTVVYYDSSKKQNVTLTTYSGDWENINKRIVNGNNKNEGFSCAFISTKKRA